MKGTRQDLRRWQIGTVFWGVLGLLVLASSAALTFARREPLIFLMALTSAGCFRHFAEDSMRAKGMMQELGEWDDK